MSIFYFDEYFRRKNELFLRFYEVNYLVHMDWRARHVYLSYNNHSNLYSVCQRQGEYGEGLQIVMQQLVCSFRGTYHRQGDS